MGQGSCHLKKKKLRKEKKKSIWSLQDRSLWKTVGGKKRQDKGIIHGFRRTFFN